MEFQEEVRVLTKLSGDINEYQGFVQVEWKANDWAEIRQQTRKAYF